MADDHVATIAELREEVAQLRDEVLPLSDRERIVTQRLADGGALDFGGARYLDRLERRDGERRIAARKLLVDLTARSEVAALVAAESELHRSRDRNDPSYQRPLQVEIPGAS